MVKMGPVFRIVRRFIVSWSGVFSISAHNWRHSHNARFLPEFGRTVGPVRTVV
jgi:hypothetical protein